MLIFIYIYYIHIHIRIYAKKSQEMDISCHVPSARDLDGGFRSSDGDLRTIAIFWYPSLRHHTPTYIAKNTYKILSTPRWICFLGIWFLIYTAIRWKTIGCRPILRLWLCWCRHFLQISDGLQDLLKFQLFCHGHLNRNPHFFQLQIGWAFRLNALVTVQASPLPLIFFWGISKGLVSSPSSSSKNVSSSTGIGTLTPWSEATGWSPLSALHAHSLRSRAIMLNRILTRLSCKKGSWGPGVGRVVWQDIH